MLLFITLYKNKFVNFTFIRFVLYDSCGKRYRDTTSQPTMRILLIIKNRKSVGEVVTFWDLFSELAFSISSEDIHKFIT